MNGNCEHLGPKGCVLGEEKPFSCTLYPLSFNPKSQTFYFDVECPIMPEYVEQLASPKSVASKHLAAMATGIKKYMNLASIIDYQIFCAHWESPNLLKLKLSKKRGSLSF
jgi:Fe-S-cluster containining protein